MPIIDVPIIDNLRSLLATVFHVAMLLLVTVLSVCTYLLVIVRMLSLQYGRATFAECCELNHTSIKSYNRSV